MILQNDLIILLMYKNCMHHFGMVEESPGFFLLLFTFLSKNTSPSPQGSLPMPEQVASEWPAIQNVENGPRPRLKLPPKTDSWNPTIGGLYP